MSLGARTLGDSGEQRAAAWYQAHDYEILDRNWRAGRLGEIDIVARRKGELIIAEVKTRSSDRFGLPVEAVTITKQMRLRQLGARYVSEHDGLRIRNLRFDVVSVMGTSLEVLQDAF